MNKQRRKKLEEALECIEKAMGIVECVMDEEQEAYDNLPESLQDAERGEIMSENIDTLDGVKSNLEECVDSIGEIV